MLNRIPLLLVIIVAIASAAHAQRKGPPTTAQLWAAKLDDSSAALTAGEHQKSLKISERLIRDMVEELGPGDAATKFFGLVLAHKAIALAGLGRKDEALWFWQTVISLYPGFAKSELSTFGEAGAFLDQHRELRTPIPPDERKALEKAAAIKPPIVAKRVTPVFPAGAQHFGVDGLLIVNVVIEPDGTLSSPVILKSLPAPTLSYVALDALRKWRFTPALENGKPIQTQFELAINFKL
ncbi:MAG TPA: energy transducer TonB [Thermoanaerobaculia bacterium]